MRKLALMALLAMAGCGDKDNDSGGTEGTDGTADGTDGTADGTDGTADGTDGTADGTDGTSDPIEVSAIAIAECDEGGSPRLDAALASADSISVTHDNFEGNCCADFTIEVSAGVGTLDMVYTDSGDPCDCLCSYDMTYTLINVPSGDYVVSAGGGVSDNVTVP
jgi:hypothetical protein